MRYTSQYDAKGRTVNMASRKPIKSIFLFLLVMTMTLVLTGPVQARRDLKPGAPESETDKTLSPYFWVKSDDPETDRLPLKATRAQVRIAGVIAEVTVTQVYKNEGKNTIEAIYVFPGSTRAAVHAMRMTVGDRVIEADIMERKKARQTYEQAKKEGKTASLLEQQRPNVFQMNVANILPGDEIKVEMKYTELLESEEQVYEFVYPAVVGPRYSEKKAGDAPGSEAWVETPYLHQGEAPTYLFDLSVDLRSGPPLADIKSPSHKVRVDRPQNNRALVFLGEDPLNGAKDFVLRYQLAGRQIQSGLMLYPGEKENFFLMMMEPPARVQPENIVPREYIFIVDVSGSMNGYPLTEVAKPMMNKMISNLRPNEYMNVLLFAGGSAVLSEGQSLKATEQNKRTAISWINEQRGGGGTQILPALKRALALPRKEGLSRIIVVVTDGYVNVEPEVFDLIRRNLGQANLFTFGVGSSVNRHLIEGMAQVGMGTPFVALNPEDGLKQAEKFRKYVESPVLTDISVQFDGFEANDVEPLSLPDLFALRPLILFGKYKGSPSGSITVTGRTADGDFKQKMDVRSELASKDNTALKLLWARHRIKRLSDLNNLVDDPARVKEVTDLGLAYHLMTAYTSFVAVDKVRRADGTYETVKQPLPLPSGVSDLAVADRSMAMAPAGGMARTKSMPLMAAKPSPAPMEEREETETSNKPVQPVDLGGADSPVRVTVEDVRGSITKNAIEVRLSQNMALLRSCYQKAVSKRGADIKGDIVFKLVIDKTGRVLDVKSMTDTLNDAPTRLCLLTALKTVRFDAMSSGQATVVIKIQCGKRK
jgi:Ca-activated chloride channel family protein